MKVTDLHLYSILDYTETPYKHFELSFASPSNSSSYIITNATGLDVDEIIPQTYHISEWPGVRYYNMELPPRVISLLISLNPQYSANETVSDLRDDVYKMISYTRNALIELRFMDGLTEVASIYGFLSKVESPAFTSTPQIQLTFDCEYPFFRSRTYTTVSNPGVPTATWTDSLSTAPHGYQFYGEFTAGTIPNPYTLQGMGAITLAPFIINHQFVAGDVLYLSSEDNAKHLYKVNGATTTYLTDTIGAGSVWPKMFPGSNTITLPSSNFDWVELKYRTAYWGL